MAQLLRKFNNINRNLSFENRISNIELFLQLFTSDLEYILGNLTLKNFSPSANSSLKGEVKTGINNVAELNNGLNIQWGNALITPTAANVAVEKTIVFNKVFVNTPSILVSPYTSVPQSVFCSYSDKTTKDFKILLCRNDTITTTVSWIAIGI